MVDSDSPVVASANLADIGGASELLSAEGHDVAMDIATID